MRVLHIVKTAVGASWVCHQVRVLRSLGIEVVVALPFGTEVQAQRYREASAVVVRADVDFPLLAPWLIPARIKEYRRLVRRVEPDLIHTHHVETTLLARLALGKKSQIPRVFQVAGPLHLEHNLFAGIDLATAGPQDYWIATCEWTRKKYAQCGISPNRIFFSYAGTHLKLFQDIRTGLLRRQLGLAPNALLIGMVCYMYAPKRFLGQTRGLKGHEDFFAAMRLVRQAMPRVHGVVVGGAWGSGAQYEKRLRSLGNEMCNGFLTFLGTRSDVPSLYPDLDLAVVASHSENVGGAVEPLLSGVPVVATNVGGLPDLIIPGKTGWLVPPRNPEALAAAILDALRNPEEARARALAGQARARCMFDVEITARGVASAYETMLAQRLDSIHVQVQPSAATVPSEKRVLIRAVREKTSHPLT